MSLLLLEDIVMLVADTDEKRESLIKVCIMKSVIKSSQLIELIAIPSRWV